MATKFSVEEISEILEMMKTNGVTEFRLELGEGKLFLRRGSDAPVMVPQLVTPQYTPSQYLQSPIVQSSAAGMTAPEQIQTAAPQFAQPAAAAQPEKKYHEVKSPMVGTFYRRPSPDASPYAQVGDLVRKGQTLCIVEAMKLMNEIQSDAAGKVVEVLLEDGQMAEYGEILFRIDTGV